MLEDAFSKNPKSLIISYLKLTHAENSGISVNFSQVLFGLWCSQKQTKLDWHYSFYNFEQKGTNTSTRLWSPRPAILMWKNPQPNKTGERRQNASEKQTNNTTSLLLCLYLYLYKIESRIFVKGVHIVRECEALHIICLRIQHDMESNMG